MTPSTIYLAGGCFWGTEHFFRQLGGVISARAGYANGNTDNPTYEEVYTDTTGFAETVEVRFDEDRLPLERLLAFYFMTIDPASVNRQGEDEGTRYRTGIYCTDAKQMERAGKVCGAVAGRLDGPLAVELEMLRNWYPAEERHQNYLSKNPGGYCHLSPKVFAYARMAGEIEALLEGEPDMTARLAQTAAVIHERMGFFWTGFYMLGENLAKDGAELVLAPFQGPAACVRIRKGRGVCGSSWERNESIVVRDVREFPGHIACSALSRSEIVVPVRDRRGEFRGVLDIDSREVGTFDETDRVWLELVCELLYPVSGTGRESQSCAGPASTGTR